MLPPIDQTQLTLSPLACVAVLLGLAYIFSMFGAKLPAARAVPWWALGLFLVVATLTPSLLEPVKEALGISLIGNFILATLTFFLFMEVLALSEGSATSERRLRQLVSVMAAETYSPPPRRGMGAARVLIALPCFNEATNLTTLIPALDALRADASLDLDLHVCFVDDGSTDRSPTILAARAPGAFVRHHVNIGVSGVLLTAFTIAERHDFDFVVQCDSDGQHPPAAVPALVRAARAAGADLAIGSRYVPGARMSGSTTAIRSLGTNCLSLLLRMAWPGFVCRDTTSGFRVYSQRAMRTLMLSMPDAYPEPETLAIVASRGLSLLELPVAMQPRRGGLSSLGGFRSVRYMGKVTAAIIGLRMRSMLSRKPTPESL